MYVLGEQLAGLLISYGFGGIKKKKKKKALKGSKDEILIEREGYERAC